MYIQLKFAILCVKDKLYKKHITSVLGLRLSSFVQIVFRFHLKLGLLNKSIRAFNYYFDEVVVELDYNIAK